MRLLLGGLIVLNVLVFLYGYLGLDRNGLPRPVRLHMPDVGSIRLIATRVAPPREAAGETAAETPAAVEPEETAAAANLPASPPPAEPSPPKTAEASPAGVPADAPTEASEGEEPMEGEAQAAPDMEESAAGEVEARPAEVSAAPPRPLLFCGEIGPFRSRVQARRLEDTFGVEGKTRVYHRPTMVDTSYWVYRPPLEDRARARKEVARLKEAGIRDLWLMPDGEFRNAISLGLYSRREAAYSHAEMLRNKGFEVEVRPRQKEMERYWLEFTDMPEGMLRELGERLPEGVFLEKKVCEQASAAP